MCIRDRRIAGKKVLIVNEVDHMSPCMTGNQKTLDPDPVDTLWFGADGGYSFISSLAEDNKPVSYTHLDVYKRQTVD